MRRRRPSSERGLVLLFAVGLLVGWLLGDLLTKALR